MVCGKSILLLYSSRWMPGETADFYIRLLGTMAFICIFVSILIVVLIFKGHTLRRFNLVSEPTEDGVDLTTNRSGSIEAQIIEAKKDSGS